MTKGIVINKNFLVFSKEINHSLGLTQSKLVNLLAEAIKKNLLGHVKLLLEKGAEPNKVADGNFWNSLHLAIEYENIDIINILIKYNADLDYPDNTGLTPLHHAVDIEADGAYQFGVAAIPKISKLLLDKGANPQKKDKQGFTAVDLAKDYEYSSFLSLVEELR